MSYVQVGSCPQCGSPVYAPQSWMGTIPPPSTPSCNCSIKADTSDVVSVSRSNTLICGCEVNWEHRYVYKVMEGCLLHERKT